jgi:phosphohistidine phosphatase
MPSSSPSVHASATHPSPAAGRLHTHPNVSSADGWSARHKLRRGLVRSSLIRVQLYLVQHGRAKTEDEDPDRPLTDQGVEDVARVAHHAVAQLGVRPTRVFHSGKTRARQTAEAWGRLLNADVEPADALAPNDDPTIWLERLRSEADDLMLVGHQPHLARLAGLLLIGDADRPVVRFRNGGVVGLERTDTAWVMSVVLPPR